MYSTTKIKSIKQIGIKQTYDVKVYPNHNFFLSNGILSHNSGKSILAQQIAHYLDPTFNIDRMCLTGEEFLKNLNKSKKGQAIVMDEAFKDLDSSQSQKRMAKTLRHAMAEMGQKNLFVILVLPSFFELTRYPAIHRSIGLIHVYTGKNLNRGFFSFYGKKKKQNIYMRGRKYYSYCERPDFYGQFTNKYVLDEEAYRKKKSDALKEFTEGSGMDVEEGYGTSPRRIDYVRLGRAIYGLRKLGITSRAILDLISVRSQEIQKILTTFQNYEIEKYGGLERIQEHITNMALSVKNKKIPGICSICGGVVKKRDMKCVSCFKKIYPEINEEVINKEGYYLLVKPLSLLSLEEKKKRKRLIDSLKKQLINDPHTKELKELPLVYVEGEIPKVPKKLKTLGDLQEEVLTTLTRLSESPLLNKKEKNLTPKEKIAATKLKQKIYYQKKKAKKIFNLNVLGGDERDTNPNESEEDKKFIYDYKT